MAKATTKRGAAKRRDTKISTRKVVYRFRGINRALSKGVNELESKLALTQRHLKAALKRVGNASLIDEVYQTLTPGNRRRLMEQAKLLQAFQKKG